MPRKARGENTCPTSDGQWGGVGEEEGVPDIFQVAVGGLSGLLLSRQAQLFGELPESGSVKDAWLTRRHRGNRQSGNNRLSVHLCASKTKCKYSALR